MTSRFRAPREPGQALIVPPLAQAGELLRANHDLRRPFADTSARAELIAAAVAYTRQYRDLPDLTLDPQSPIVMAGHQPELFHSGVWFKNFLLSELAARNQAIAINLVVDNDTVDAPGIRVPTGPHDSPQVETVALDVASEGIPFEERSILDPALFDSFADRVTEAARQRIAHPLVNELWRHVRRARGWTANLGQLLASARHQLEGEWGLNTLEVPLSTITAQPSFRRFALAKMCNADQFAQIYNAALHEYRIANHIRSRSHPVPDLASDDGWHEAPFWIWSREQPHRRRLFVRTARGAMELTDRADFRVLFSSDDSALNGWSDLEHRGIKIRPRALMTTMYARLVLSDLFIHGIGGAKYDELTDAIIRRSLGIEPPAYLTATATIALPLEYSRVTEGEVRRAQSEDRELRFHAERVSSDAALVARKKQLLAELPARGTRKTWHREITNVNESLAAGVASQRAEALARAAKLVEQHRLARLLGSREFSFALFPGDFLRNLLLDLSRANA